MPYIGCGSFVICVRCTRMYNSFSVTGHHGCPDCGAPRHRAFQETTPVERQRWQDKKYFGNKQMEKPIVEADK